MTDPTVEGKRVAAEEHLTKFIKFLGHERFAIKSVQTGRNGAQEAHFDLINMGRTVDYIRMRNGKRQLWVNVQRLKRNPEKFHTHLDVEAYTNIFIDIDAKKPDDKKDFAATERERGFALAQVPTVQKWLSDKGFKPGLGFKSGNGGGLLLPIPPTEPTPEFIAKVAAFLKVVRREANVDVDTTTFDPPRVCGVLGTWNSKFEDEEEGRKNHLREAIGEIPQRDEDEKLLEFIEGLTPDPDALKTWAEKFNQPPATEEAEPEPSEDAGEIDVDFVKEKLDTLLEADPTLQSLLDWTDEAKERHDGDRSDAEFGAVGKLTAAGFTDPQINWVMTYVSKIGKWIEAGEHYQEVTIRKIRANDADEAAEKEEIKTPTPEPIAEDLVVEARNILELGDPVTYALDTFNTIHKGDRLAGGITFCCCLTPQIETSRGAHPKLTGKSGGGKSDMAEAVLHALPSEAYIKTGLSPKALMYHPIPRGSIIYCDDYKQNDDTDTVLKQTSSNFHEPYYHRTVLKGKAAVLSVPPEIVWMITSVDSDQDLQCLNRAVPIDVDETEDQDRAVADHILALAAQGEVTRPVTREVMICRAMFRILKSKRYKVKIPFAVDIIWNDAGNRRNLPLFLDILQAITFWRRFQREEDEDGRLIATVEDFDLAKELYVGDGRGEAFKTKLTGAERKLAKLIVQEGGRLEQSEAAIKMGVSSGRITRLVNGTDPKKEGGLNHKVPRFSVVRETVDKGGILKSVNVFYLDKFDTWRDAEAVVSLRDRKKWE
jgi:hypothetical protein